jgi:molybdenum cofactor cytidylyltransferase
MGEPKLLLPWRGKTILEHVLSAWRASRVQAVFVVVPPGDKALSQIAESLDCNVVRPSLPPPDMRASVAFGLGEVRRQFTPSADDAWLVAPADLPKLSTAVIDRLISVYSPHANMALTPTVGTKRAHPVLFPWSWANRVRQLEPDEGLNVLLREGLVHAVPCDDLVSADYFMDIDEPGDYERLVNRSG